MAKTGIPTATNAALTERSELMNTNTLAAAVIGFLLGGLTVSIAAELEDDDPTTPPSHSYSSR